MKKLLLVIDFQNAFINDNTVRAKDEIPGLVKNGGFDEVAFTRFINSKENPVYKNLDWRGCMDEKSRKICMDTSGYEVFDKNTYSAFLPELCEYIKDKNIKEIYLCGIDVECCVLVTALNFFENSYNVRVLRDYVYSMNGESAKNHALEILGRNIGEGNIIITKHTIASDFLI